MPSGVASLVKFEADDRLAAAAGKRLLVLSCSAAKQRGRRLEAIDRYDGPRFRLLRRYLKVTGDKSLDIAIISARHGVVGPHDRIDFYNQKMTRSRAETLAPLVQQRLAPLAREATAVFIIASASYTGALRMWQEALSPELPVAVAKRGQLERLSQMKRWLYRLNAVNFEPKVVPYRGEATLKGKSLRISREEIRTMALAAAPQAGSAATRFRDWYVEFDGQRLAPKWLVAHLFQVSVKRFQAHDARRVLAQLGVEVHRVRARTVS
jgi:hypothetical protein